MPADIFVDKETKGFIIIVYRETKPVIIIEHK